MIYRRSDQFMLTMMNTQEHKPDPMRYLISNLNFPFRAKVLYKESSSFRRMPESRFIIWILNIS